MNGQPATTTFGEMGEGMAMAVRADSAQAFRRARRHSRRVRILRIAIPIVLVLIVGGFSFATWLDPWRLLYKLPRDIAGLTISGTKITMVAPKLSGYTRDARWYEFTAASAAQDLTKPDAVELRGVRAVVEMQDKTRLNLVAAEGIFERKAGLLTLSRDIVLTTSGGFQMNMSEAVVDIATGDIVSSKPVELKTQEAHLNANRLEVINAGELVRFDGGVSMLLTPEPESAEGAGAKP